MPRPKGARDSDYDQKRAALLERMTRRIMRREVARPSLRQLAEAAGVTVPTLRHYFGGRAEVMTAILEAYRQAGGRRLEMLATPEVPFEESIRQFAFSLLMAVQMPREVKLGDVFAVSIAEGLLDEKIGPAALEHIVDPSVDVLQARLRHHIARGEMIEADTRAAALMLLSPLLLAILHQQHMGGATCNPADLPKMTEELCAAFIRAYKAPAP
ncbi:TetR/AcrR family transcriptional regulator [Phenylobacterium sp.]|uniref:TetR/AcrR family transcriptional regulator n=1 Tax=Phenylobacterium sp. TaxID=1871053 RepID=UPI0035AE3EDF